MNILITLCGRGGSKGIPGKNVKPLNNIPLIAYSINTAKKFALLHKADVTVSTDDVEIKKVAADYGVYTDYLRPDYLASDTAGKIGVIADILKYEEKNKGKIYDYVLDLDITSPLRTIEDLCAAFDLILSDDNAYNLFSVNTANKSPYFNMVEANTEGYYGLSKKPLSDILTRQSAPKVYELNASFYFYRKCFFVHNCTTAITDKSLVYVMPHICFDLDHLIDFEFLDFLLKNNKLDFEL